MLISEASDKDIDEAIEYLKNWVEETDFPDSLIVVSSANGYTPRSILQAIEEKRREGNWESESPDLPETVLSVLINRDKTKDKKKDD